ncbi:MAG: hypothetical protein MHPSP_001012, partial [Paramarteilia canceri]
MAQKIVISNSLLGKAKLDQNTYCEFCAVQLYWQERFEESLSLFKKINHKNGIVLCLFKLKREEELAKLLQKHPEIDIQEIFHSDKIDSLLDLEIRSRKFIGKCEVLQSLLNEKSTDILRLLVARQYARNSHWQTALILYEEITKTDEIYSE